MNVKRTMSDRLRILAIGIGKEFRFALIECILV